MRSVLKCDYVKVDKKIQHFKEILSNNQNYNTSTLP